LLHGVGGQVEVRQKFLVLAMAAVVRLFRRHEQQFFDEREVEVEEECSVEEEEGFAAALGVS